MSPLKATSVPKKKPIPATKSEGTRLPWSVQVDPEATYTDVLVSPPTTIVLPSMASSGPKISPLVLGAKLV